MIPNRVRLATLIAFLFHGLLIITARYRFSYDAYVHIFFGDHYAKNWWSLWDTRWYTGFFVSSYPPLVHQLIGLLSHITGLEAAFAIILLISLTLYPLAVYSFSSIFVGKTISSYASLGAALLPSIFLSAHIFGQLPFLVSTLLALFSAASLAHYLREGGFHNFALTICLTTSTMAAHHATLLVQPFLIFAVVTTIYLNHKLRTWRRDKFSSPTKIFSRLLLFAVFAVALGIMVIWPFWDWGRAQTLQTPIDHLSRHNFFKDPLAIVLFFIPMYGPLALFIPFALSVHHRRIIGLTLAFLFLFIIGLGDTTPLPRVLFGQGWEWLTYDRFALWASIVLLPFFGIAVLKLRRKVSSIVIFGTLAASCFIIGFITVILPLQPGQVDMDPIVNFLETGGHDQYRYLTFGFGDQLALLSTLTTATTMDGSYHTARELPELRDSGIAQIDTAYWNVKGLAALDPILQKASGRGVRWGFVNVKYYVPVLERNGWTRIIILKDGVQIWENLAAIYPSAPQPPQANRLAEFSWGVFPLLSLFMTLTLGSLRAWPQKAEKVMRDAHAFLVGLIPLALGFWYYKLVGEFNHEKVYFTYDHALVFLGDGVALIAVILWLVVQISKNNFFNNRNFSQTDKLLLALCCLITLSTLWSADWRTSAYISLHFWLVFALILSMRDWHASWNTAILGLCTALSIQALMGIVNFILQSTLFLKPFNLEWPGVLDPMTHAASVVNLQNGQAYLRAYGTLPHPNILGGFTLLCMTGPIALFLRKEKPNPFALLLLALGSSLLALTFSRSAWIATAIFLFILICKSKFLNQKKAIIAFLVMMIAFGLTLIPLRDLFINRTSSPTTSTERFSLSGRIWLAGQTIALIEEHPLFGVGAGAFIIKLAERAGEFNFVEPVHNIPLLVMSELGIFGLALHITIVISIGKSFFQNMNSNTLIIVALLAGLGTISIFDHYLWTLAPGRLILAFALGLWEGQTRHDK